jgi:integrase
MARTHKLRLFGDSLPEVTLPYGDSSSFVTLNVLFRRTGLIHAEEPARRTPELFWEASPVVERQRPAAQARIARDRIVLVDAAQDRVSSRDFIWLAEIPLVARPPSKLDRIVMCGVLVEAGLTLINEAEFSSTLTERARACQVRNGLMVALLALCPIRPKNFGTLEIGRSFVKINGTWWNVLSASETKEKRPDERPINELLTPVIDRYLGQYRPVLARADNSSSALWLCCNIGAPIKDRRSLREVISATKLATVGVAVSPHLIRSCAASTAAIHGGDNPYLASALLHHTHPNVTNAHYNRATSMTAAKSFRQIVRRYGKND